MSFCTEAGSSGALLQRFSSLTLSDSSTPGGAAPASQQPPASSTPAAVSPGTATPPPGSEDLSRILAALRKLREGIVASARDDRFATQAYLFALRLGVLCRSPETYHPAALHLLRVVHPRGGLTSLEHHEAAAYLVLDAACRRADLAAAYALRSAHRLRDAKVDDVLGSLVRDDWVAFFRVRDRLDGHMVRIVQFAERDMRMHLLKAFGRAYLSVSLPFLEASTGLSWDRLRDEFSVGWELDGDRVIIRKIHGRS
ncbi:hypothetical protein VTK73DRAFT_2711 [Phialemonium thermophilum]|uniref:CSN8/PSMD8/EIF3K domain-containing protein n=1 Tax=Phialemonium thermophilum TaxID=223376 RepID=A0ABR3VQ79_9PEZI